MKNRIVRVISLCLITALILPNLAFGTTVKGEKGEEQKVTKVKNTISIVFSHDMHSHLEKFPKISTVIKEVKKTNDSTFVLDAGDFSMGTPFQTIYKSQAAELRMMGNVGYDATTLGNHEFDYRSKGLSAMLGSAVIQARTDAAAEARKTAEKVFNRETRKWETEEIDPAKLDIKLPKLVISNIDWDSTLSNKDTKNDGEILKNAMKNYGAASDKNSYLVIKRGGAKICVFGIFGKESASYAPESGTEFLDPIETAQATVDKIKKKEKNVDLIVCLSHSGTNSDDPKKSEDENMAKEVKGIDLIISGHSHTYMNEPLQVEDTLIVSAGQYNDNIGEITFKKSKGEYSFNGYQLVPLNDQIKDDRKTENKIKKFKKLADKEYFSNYGMKWDSVLARNNISFTDIDEFGLEQGEDTLGNIIADSYIYGVKQAEGSKYEKVDLAVAPFGVIRGSFDTGNVTASDAFNALSLGTGKDGKAGYPLVSVYLTGKELKLVAEIDASVSDIMTPARLYLSGMKYTYNPNRIILDRAYDIKIDKGNGKTEEIDNKKMYRVVADLYSAQMLGTVDSMSYGLLSVVPKDKNGNPIENYENFIIYDRQGKELKEWYALASYIDSFPGNTFPSKYSAPEGRKILEDSSNIIDILKKPNRFIIMLAAIIIFVISFVSLIIAIIVRSVRGRNYGFGTVKKRDRMFSRR